MKIKVIWILNIITVVMLSLFMCTPLYRFQGSVLLGTLMLMWLAIAIHLDSAYLNRMKKWSCYILVFFILDIMLSITHNSEQYFYFMLFQKIFVYWWTFFLVFYSEHRKQIKTIVISILIIYMISAVLTIVGCLQYPGAARWLATGIMSAEIESQKSLYRSMGIGGYDFIYASVFLLFPIITLAREKIKYKWVYLVVVINIITVLTGAFTTGIVLAFVAILLSCAKTRKFFNTIVVVMLITWFVILFKESLLIMLRDIAKSMDMDMVVQRVTQLLDNSYASSEGNRVTRFANGVSNIIASPIFGSMLGSRTMKRSGHSALLKFFELYGVFGMFYISYIISTYKFVVKRFQNVYIKNRYLLYCCTTFLILIMNTFDTAPCLGIVFFFIGPIIFLEADSEENIKIKI